ncbi:MAG: M48 family metalloprotease [Pyrinomonadaceae bacterium]|nr:M48 family metalloprotease [Pyrinomonadaceae bacterium]
MDTEQITRLIDRLEDYSKQHPSNYRLKVAALAALGYAYLFAVVLVLLLIVFLILFYVKFNAVTVKVVWIPLVLVGLVLRSLWITLPEPDGQELLTENAPKLFDLISEVRSALDGPQVHRVLVSDEFNAGIVQIPQLGMFGWLRNYLVVGLPLMKALSPAEFRAVLAHEFGHLSGNHGRFSGWIYRMRQSWVQVLVRVHEQRQYAAFLFERFLNWYAPYFNAYSFVLARAQEYEADGYSVDLAGRETAARTLVRVNTKERALQEDFWPGFYRQSYDEAQPPRDTFSQMLTGLEKSVDRSTAEKWFLQAVKVKTGYDDTHPSLADRLAAMGYQLEGQDNHAVPESLLDTDVPGEITAADYYLGTLPEDFIPGCDRLWTEQIAQNWREQHQGIQEKRARLSELEEKSKSQPLTPDEQLERAHYLREDKDSDAPEPILLDLIRQDSTHPVAHYLLGAILLERQDQEGIEFLEKAMQLEPGMTGSACELIYQFLRSQGQQKEAYSYRSRAEKYFETLQQQQEQALKFTYKDRFEPHDLETDQIAELQNQLRNVRAVGTAYLVRKIVEGAPQPFYILGVVAAYDDSELLNRLVSEVGFSRPLGFVLLGGKNKFLQPMFDSIMGAQIFPAR